MASQVAKLGGAERLVRLCKDEHERNHSDAVLVACLVCLNFVILYILSFYKLSHCGFSLEEIPKNKYFD